MYAYGCTSVGVQVLAHVWRTEDNISLITVYLPFFSETVSLPDLELTLTGRLAFQ